MRVAVPSTGRLRDGALALLSHAGYGTSVFRGSGARAVIDGIEFIEMRPRDAGAWLASGRINAAFSSTDIRLEEGLDDLAAVPLGTTRSDLVLASRDDDGRLSVEDLEGAVVATHLPNTTTNWFRQQAVQVAVVTMGGALEGVCAAGLADAIVDLRETGASLSRNGLRVLATISACEGLLLHDESAALGELALRIEAAVDATRYRYVMLHLPPSSVDALAQVFPGLAAPTILSLAGRDDLVAVHFVVEASSFWTRLSEVRAIGGTGIVALPLHALLR